MRLSPLKLFAGKSSPQTWALWVACGLLLAGGVIAQAVPYAHTYQKSREEVEAALKDMQAYSGQKLPIVDGFIAMGDKPLDRYERAFCQFAIELIPGDSGATIVQVTAKITAWYADRDPAKSGYQVLPSNGRLELDLLDRLDSKLGAKHVSAIARAASSPTIVAPKPKLDFGEAPGGMPPSAGFSANAHASSDEVAALRAKREAEEKHMKELSDELQSLREVQQHQAHPPNLVIVKKSGTPVFAKPSEGARVLFNAAADDEFEFIDNEGPWIHVQISGPSRGYVRRNNVELPELIAERLNSPNAGTAGDESVTFRMAREETSNFPGNWEPLKGRTVKIYTLQPASQAPKETGGQAKLAFAGTLFQKSAATPANPPVEGIVVIFDSADGGILGATLASVRQFAAGTLSAEAFWKQCYMDPPEAFQEARKP